MAQPSVYIISFPDQRKCIKAASANARQAYYWYSEEHLLEPTQIGL